MDIRECSSFLQEALPRLGLRWAGFRKVRRLVCKRLARRIGELNLADLAAYREYLAGHGGEWPALEALCRIPVSRFYRDRQVFDFLGREVLPRLADNAITQGRLQLNCWSACCASGEEPYTIAMLWLLRVAPLFPSLLLTIVATDVDPGVLDRARRGCYAPSSLKEMPEDLLRGFAVEHGGYCVRAPFRIVRLAQQDIRQDAPRGRFDLILCRNSVLTYLLPEQQEPIMQRIIERLESGGALVVGLHESVPRSCVHIAPWGAKTRAIYRASGAWVPRYLH